MALSTSTQLDFCSDLDFLMTGGQGCPDNSTAHCPGQSPDEYRTEFTFWAMTVGEDPFGGAREQRHICRISPLQRSVLLFATDPRNLTAVMREALFNDEVRRLGYSFVVAKEIDNHPVALLLLSIDYCDQPSVLRCSRNYPCLGSTLRVDRTLSGLVNGALL